MRNWIIGAAAVLALAVPGAAAAQTGYAGVIYGSADSDGATDEEEFYGVEGAVAFSGSGSIVFEVDASYVDADEDEAYGLVGHVYARNDDHLFGGFIGLSGNDDSETYLVGLEANKYFAGWTLAGAIAYGNNDDAEADGFGANVEARFFIHDNFRIDANVGYASIDSDLSGDEEDVTLLGLGGEYQFASVPISVRAGYSTTDSDGGDEDLLSIGLRYNWGGTLRDRDRNGASQASVVRIAGF